MCYFDYANKTNVNYSGALSKNLMEFNSPRNNITQKCATVFRPTCETEDKF